MKKRVLTALGLLLISLSLQSCTRVHELDAPCKNFGRYCSQELVNIQEYENYHNNKNKEK